MASRKLATACSRWRLAFAARDLGAFAQQALKVWAAATSAGVVAAVHEVLRDDAALDVAVVAAADAQQVRRCAGPARRPPRRAAVGLLLVQVRCSSRALAAAASGVSSRCHAVGDGAQGFGP
jgi:hypothetical protein